jgi:hypothetical protein
VPRTGAHPGRFNPDPGASRSSRRELIPSSNGPLRAITEFAATIDTLARRLEDALAAPRAGERAA